MTEAPDYAFPHSAEDESRRLELLEQRLDPLTKRRIHRLGISKGARCLEIGAGRGSITRWLSDVVGPAGRPAESLIPLDSPPYYCMPLYPGGLNTCGGPPAR